MSNVPLQPLQQSRLLVPNAYVTGYVWRVDIKNVSGNTVRACYFGHDENNSAGVVITDGGSLRDITLENVSLSTGTVNSFNYPLMNIHTNPSSSVALDVQNITIQNVTIDQYYPTGPLIYIGNMGAVGSPTPYQGAGANVTNLIINGIFLSSNSSFNNGILTTSTPGTAGTPSVVNLNTVSISNVVSKLATSTYALVNLNSGQLAALNIDRCQWIVTAATNSDAVVTLCGLSQATGLNSIDLNVTNCQLSHNDQLIQVINSFASAPSTQVIYNFTLMNCTCSNTGNVCWLANGGTYTNGGTLYPVTMKMWLQGTELNNQLSSLPLYRIIGQPGSCPAGSTLQMTSSGNSLTGGNVHTSFLALNNGGYQEHISIMG